MQTPKAMNQIVRVSPVAYPASADLHEEIVELTNTHSARSFARSLRCDDDVARHDTWFFTMADAIEQALAVGKEDAR